MRYAAVGDLAIIGVGCRFPGGVHNAASYWDLLASGRDGVIEVPDDRWNVDSFYDPRPDAPGKMYVRAGGFLTQRIDAFDAAFFGMSPREAAYLDPQQRLLMEVAWEALEDAGIAPENLAGSDTGVYVGGFMVDNMLTQFSPLNRDQIGPHSAVSSTLTILSNRLSYLFDLRGPSVTMDTACSSSLVAMHQACQSLWRGESCLALVGGVNVMHRPETMIAMCKGGFLSPDGRSKSFDARADGYGRGEGAGLVIIKPAAQAIADRDQIYALVRATGVNQDGRTDGITVPNPRSQEALIRAVCARAGIEPRMIRYVEAHGTGTPVGDPLEAAALGAVVGDGRSNGDACVIGSVKANIGHLEAAAGVAGLIKAALCLKHRVIPPIANLQTPNPTIDFDGHGLKLARELQAMPEGEGPALAAVNSFGYGGTNAHVILQEAPADEHPEASRDPHLGLLTISARSRSALAAMAADYRDRLAKLDDADLADFRRSAALRRGHYDHRLAVGGATVAETAERLSAFLADGHAPGLVTGACETRGERPVFVFSGMGPQWWAMGRELMSDEPVFRRFVEECDALFEPIAGWSILDEMMREEGTSRIGETQIAQPANFVLQAGLAALWRSWGVEPAAVVGHSVGEVSSAYVSGQLSLEDAIRVSYHRSRVQKKAAGQGTMLAVGLTEADATPFLLDHHGKVSLAAANGPSSLTLAGETASLEAIAANLQKQGIFNRFLQVEMAYHSPFMEPLKPELLTSLEGLTPKSADWPVYSTVTGRLAEKDAFDAAYWCRNIREPVFFAKTIDTLIDTGHRLFLEIGPHPVLSTSLKQCLAAHKVEGRVLASLRRGAPEAATLLDGLAGLYVTGSPIDWRQLHAGEGRYVPLPGYSWQRDTHWREGDKAFADRLGRADHALLGNRAASPNLVWESNVNLTALPYVADHVVENLVVLPGAAYVELGLAVHREIGGDVPALLEDLEFRQALVVEGSEAPQLHVAYDEAARRYMVHSRARGVDGWTEHARGRLSFAPFEQPAPIDLDALRKRFTTSVSAEAHYAAMAGRGLSYGPFFQGVRELALSDDGGEVLAFIEGHGELDEACRLHPTLLDACFQALLAMVDIADDANVYVPTNIREIRLSASPIGGFWCHGRTTRHGNREFAGDLVLYDRDGAVLGEIRGVRAQALTQKATSATSELSDWFYQLVWRDAPQAPLRAASGRWIVFAGESGARIAADLEGTGADSVLRVTPGTAFERQDGAVVLRSEEKADIARLLDEERSEALAGIVFAWPLDGDHEEDPVGRANVASLIYLIQSMAEQGRGGRLVVVTRNAQAAPHDADDVMPAQAPVVGVVRVAVNEHADIVFRMIDMDGSADTLGRIVDEILADSDEDEIALRGEQRYTHRLERRSISDLDAGRPARATTSDTAAIASTRRDPLQGEVEVAVSFATIGAIGAPGVDAVGAVARVGEDVERVAPGDDVFVHLDGAAVSYVTVPDCAVVSLAAAGNADQPDAMALPALAAAHHALDRVGRITRGESILVHGAETPFGLAAIQIAGLLGAVVYVTANDPARRSYLRGLRVAETLDSSSIAFADQIMEATQGRGVDAVLNMVEGELGTRTLELLAPFGRFLDASGALAANPGAAARLKANQSAISIDIPHLFADGPDLFNASLVAVVKHIKVGQLGSPALPAPIVEEAGQPLGDDGSPHWRVIDYARLRAEAAPVAASRPDRIDPDASYLVTGGYGGFGLELAKWLVELGARNLVLVSRRGAATPDGRRAVEDLEARGIRVHAASADVSDGAAVERLFAEIAAEMPPLKGVFHAAAVLDDGPIHTVRPEQLDAVLRPKALGAWHLHRHTAALPLDCFMLFSSIASLIGSPGQATYVVANSFLDALAHHRRARGLPAISINFGALSEVGMAARHEGVEQHLARVGVGSLTPQQALAAIGRILAWNPVQLASAKMEWRLWGEVYPAWAASPRYRHLMPAEGADQVGEAETQRRRLAALPAVERETEVGVLFTGLVAEILRLKPDDVDGTRSLLSMGVDSLMAMELQIRIEKKLGVKVSTLELMRGSSFGQLIAHLAAILDGAGEPTSKPGAQPLAAEAPRRKLTLADFDGDIDVSELLARLDELSAEEMDQAIEKLSTPGLVGEAV